MKVSNIPLAQLSTELLQMWKIKQIVISPGSRNAPLTLSFTSNSFFDCYSIVDERSAGFFALGMAQSSRKPVVLVCTSGSALLNYFPAIAEAFYSDIPLIVLSADRPPYKIDIGDGQTIRQDNVYGNHVAFYHSFLLDQSGKHPQDDIIELDHSGLMRSQKQITTWNRQFFNEAIRTLLLKNKPVHLNLPFEEPLYEMAEMESFLDSKEAISMPPRVVNADDKNVQPLLKIWQESSSIIVLIGVLEVGSIEQELIDFLCEQSKAIVLTETTSNIHHPNTIASIDQIMAPIELSDKSEEFFDLLQAELIITIGGMVVSKKIKSFLRKHSFSHHFHLGQNQARDTFFLGVMHIDFELNSIITLLKNIPTTNNKEFNQAWRAIYDRTKEAKNKYLTRIPYSDFSVYHSICDRIPRDYVQQWSNSSAIRYAQLFASSSNNGIYCNRGTSGIDGSVSTAMGYSINSDKPVVLIAGDLSFFYDSNALWNAYTKKNFRIILINNQGGGIFRILPGPKNTVNFEKYFETKHQLSAKHLCAMHEWDYLEAEDEKSLELALQDIFESSERPRLLEINTPSQVNDEVLLNYFQYLSSRI